VVVWTDIATGVISPDLAANIPFEGRNTHESQDLCTKIQAFFGSRLWLKRLLRSLRPGEEWKNKRVNVKTARRSRDFKHPWRTTI
jgi:hypothetical protein